MLESDTQCMGDTRGMGCYECGEEPGAVYPLRIERLHGGSLMVSMIYCEACADEVLACDWIEERSRDPVEI